MDGLQRTPRRRWTTTRAILVALLAVVASFVASTAYTESRAAGIDAAAVSIAENAAPSVEHLAAARADLRRLQTVVSDSVNDAVLGRRGDVARVAAIRADLSREMEAYLELPVYPGERERWEKVSKALAELDRISGETLSLVYRGRVAEANDLADHALQAAFDRTSDAIIASIDFNARQANNLARTIEESRVRARRITLALDLLSVGLAALAGGVAIAFVQRHERLLDEHALLVERRADELDQFAARVAHDIAGPLGTVLLANHLVCAKVVGDTDAQETLARCSRAARRVQRIVDGLLDFARAGAKPELGARAAVAPVIEDLAIELEPTAKAADAELVIEPFAPCEVAASPGVLTSLVANLVRNAIKYLGDAPLRRVIIRVLEALDTVRVEVEDTGPGVPPTLAGIIFQPYVRGAGSSEPGLGLGLGTVKSLTEAHGGRVGLRSVVGKGSTFWFELPKPSRARPATITVGAPAHPS